MSRRPLVRVRTDVAAAAQGVRLPGPAGVDRRRRGRHRVRVVLHGRCVGGWVVEDDVTPPTGGGSCAPEDTVGVGATGALGGVGRLGRLALGRPQLVLPGTWPHRRRWSRGSSTAPRRRSVRPSSAVDGRHRGAGRCGPAAPGPTLVRLSPTTDLIDVVLSALDDPERRRGRRCARAGALGRLGRATVRPPGAAGLSGDDGLGRGAGGVAASWWGAGPARGHRCRGWPVASCSTPTTSAYREESSPTYSAVDVASERARRRRALPACCLLVPARGVTAAGGPAVGPARRRGEGGWSDDRERRPSRRRPTHAACSPRSSSAWPDRCSTTRRRSSDWVRWSASTTGPAGPAAGLRAIAANWRRARACGAAVAPADEAACAARAAGDTRPRSVPRAGGCA